LEDAAIIFGALVTIAATVVVSIRMAATKGDESVHEGHLAS
jgi:hypothetical protein